MIVRPAPAEHFGWIARRAGLAVGPGFRAIEALSGPTDECVACGERHGRIAGMIGLDGWTQGSVSLHVALDAPIALRALLRQAFGLAFIQFDKPIATAMVLSTNTRSLELVRHIGFREVFRGADYWSPGVDMVLFEMRREECRFLDRKSDEARVQNHGQEAA